MSKACFKLDTDGRYCVTKGKISFCVLFFPLSTEHLLVNLISDSSFSTKLRGLPLSRKCLLNCEMFSSKVSFEEFVLRIHKASPLTNPFFMLGGWQEVKCVYWKVSVGLKCVFTSRID